VDVLHTWKRLEKAWIEAGSLTLGDIWVSSISRGWLSLVVACRTLLDRKKKEKKEKKRWLAQGFGRWSFGGMTIALALDR